MHRMFVMPGATIIPFKGKMPRLAPGVFIAAGVAITGDVTVGTNSSIWFNTVARGDVNHIRIGERTNIQDNSVIHVTSGGHPTIIGNDVTVGHNAILHACTIEDSCLIGMGAIIMDGAIIRKGSLVAAGSVVPPGREFPPGSLIMGSPAAVKRPVTPEESAFFLKSALGYIETAREYAPT
jgi:carbonic anhydrase/acetyltransferase-like protein (isoleucine patch superfamily)